MTRPIAGYGIVLGIVALGACAGDPQAPTPIAPPPTTPAAPVAPPTPPPSSPSGNSLAGSYTLTVDIGSGCAVIPEAERIRRYSAVIDGKGEGRYVVTLGDATFLAGSICAGGSGRLSENGCQQFFASQDGDTVEFLLANENDDTHAGHIVELSSSGAWLEIIGNAGGRFGASSIEASGTSSVWYCRSNPSAYPFPCSSFVGCGSTDMRLTLTRR
jgi:hypothetical protein